ncbi:MAG: LegC family aminotransferase [Dechloromonas sp.]|nr:LegC family aminotransferase [Dechloromonas sp.]
MEAELVSRLSAAIGPAKGTVALHEPSFNTSEARYLMACLKSTFVSSVGAYVDRFEGALADFTGARHAVAVVNATAGLHVALIALGVDAGSEVLVPGLSFVATANAVAHCGALPHFVDASPATLGMDPHALERHLREVVEKTAQGPRNRVTGRRVAAIVPMHTFGHPAEIEELQALATRWGIPLVEDAAESLGSFSNGRHTGTFGAAGVLSFNGNKIITTGGGGAIITNDDALARRLKHLTTAAKLPHRWEFFHDEVAWNYRMPNLNAALGCAQLEKLETFLSNKRALAARYRQAFADSEHFEFVGEPAGTASNYWLNAIRLRKGGLDARDRALTVANEAGYQCRPVWVPLHRLPMYGAAPRAPLPIAEDLYAHLVNIPSSARLMSNHE